MPQQRATELALIEGVERMNVVIIRNQGQRQRIELPRRDLYAMEVDRGRNCYSCGGFGYLVWNCRRQSMSQEILQLMPPGVNRDMG